MRERILPFLQREVHFPPGVVRGLTQVGKAFSGVVYVLEGSLQLDSAGQQDVLETGDLRLLGERDAEYLGRKRQVALSGLGCHFRTGTERRCNPVNQA